MAVRFWRRHPRAARVTLGLGASCLALLLCEGLVRVFSLGPQVNPVIRESLRLSANPVLEYELLPGAPDGSERINSAGMRERELARAKPPGVRRIAAIGDSICYGYAVARHEAFPARLEAHLAAAGATDSIQVLNLGVTGYSITQAVENLAVRGLAYQPDLVVYAYSLNDPDPFSFDLMRLTNRLSAAESNFRDRALGRTGGWLIRHSRLYALGLYTWESLTLEGQVENPAVASPRWRQLPRDERTRDYWTRLYGYPVVRERLEAGLDRLAALAEEYDFEVLIVIFPAMDHLADYPSQYAHEQVAAAAAARNLPVLDLLPVFRGRVLAGEDEDGLRVDHLHPNARGHDLAAAAVAEALRTTAAGSLAARSR